MSTYTTIDREPIWVAAYNALKAGLGTSVVTCGRKHVMPPDLSPNQQPAAFLVQIREHRQAGPRGLPGKLMLEGMIFIYVYPPLTDSVPGKETSLAATKINELLKLVDDSFQPDLQGHNEYCSLGGVVSHCWVEGQTDQDPGIFGDQAMATVPLHILIP